MIVTQLLPYDVSFSTADVTGSTVDGGSFFCVFFHMTEDGISYPRPLKPMDQQTPPPVQRKGLRLFSLPLFHL